MIKNRNYSVKTIKQLYGASGGHCSRCKCRLIYPETSNDESVQIGEIGLVALNDNGPRGDANFPDNELNKYENLILLCPNCHSLIDNQPNSYTIEVLKKMKKDHENWVSKQLDISMAKIDNAELEIAVRNIATNRYFTQTQLENFDFTDIK